MGSNWPSAMMRKRWLFGAGIRRPSGSWACGTRRSCGAPRARSVRSRRRSRPVPHGARPPSSRRDRKSTRLNSSHLGISYAVFCLKKKKIRESDDYWIHKYKLQSEEIDIHHSASDLSERYDLRSKHSASSDTVSPNSNELPTTCIS